MPENLYKIQIVRDLRPSYYDKFQCLAAACRDSCCKGWRITFDKKDYLSLKQQKGSAELNGRMTHALRRVHKQKSMENVYAEFSLGSGICALQREDGLCLLQVEKGHQALPDVCKIFPRTELFTHSGYLERCLSLACEGVLALLWELPDGVDFYSDPLPMEKAGIFSFKARLFGMDFQNIRSWCIDMLQDRRYPLPERIMRIGVALEKLSNEQGDIANWLDNICDSIKNQERSYIDVSMRDKLLLLFLSNNIRVLFSLSESLNPKVEVIQQRIMKIFLEISDKNSQKAVISAAPWMEARKRFEERFAGKEYFMENIMVALFYQLQIPDLTSAESMWKSFVNFCNLYSFYRFMAIMSCYEESEAGRDALFDSMVFSSRVLMHNAGRREGLQKEFFENDSATLAHMAVLLSN